MCGIFPYFSFSLKLSVVLHVSRLAKRDLVSYIIIFLIIVFGFGIGGYMIYGDKLENFNSVLRASLEIILMTIGGVNYELMKSAERQVTPIFVFTYLIAAYIIFLKMFIVILDATYRDLINHVVKEDITFLAYVNTLVKGLVKNIDVYMRGRTTEEIKAKYKEKKGTVSKVKLYIELFYNGFIKKVEEKLWMVVKAIIIIKDKDYEFNRNQDQKELLDRFEMYSGLRNAEPCRRITIDSGDRFTTFFSLKSFMSHYHSESGIKGASSQGEKTGNKEDSFTNEWFNNLNRYIESSTN